MTRCELVNVLQWISAIATLLAALFWGRASIIYVPAKIGFSAVFGEFVDNSELENLARILRRQGAWNAAGAGFAAVAALTQGVTLLMPSCAQLIDLKPV